MSAQERFGTESFTAIVRSKVRASAGAYERNDRLQSVFMFAVRGSGATRIIVVRGTQRARTPPPSPFNNRASGKCAGPISLVPSGEAQKPVLGVGLLRTFRKVIGVVQPSLRVSIRVSLVRARRRIRGSDGSRTKGQNRPFKRTETVQGFHLEMQACS